MKDVVLCRPRVLWGKNVRALALLPVVVLLAGCSAFSPNGVQFSGDTVPFPAHYQRETARIVAKKGADRAQITVSYPRNLIGATPLSPQRWYSCVRGLSVAKKPERLPRIDELLQGVLDPGANQGIHNVMLVFNSDTARPAVREGFDLPLCRDGQYEPLTADAPLM
ncbi:hypothetical protein [Devosia psychrophila]|uniref:Lipoprotein n=1 Tax=Devosia psychrophila TaxID=728005 RepID=A0A1I1L1U5_9HYPH|nr:hypothetical protein [Devosia psychrophila]SFC67037.1 hypothetical protein SAMN04488059_108141 [Devosia psychrophila]